MLRIIDNGTGNRIAIAAPCMERLGGTITINGNDNAIEIGPLVHIPPNGSSNLNVTFVGSGSSFVAPQLGSIHGLGVQLWNGARLRIGTRTTFNNNCALLLHEPSAVTIGDDCMIGGNVRLHTSDMHGIFDRGSGERINPAADIVLGDHVWLGQQVVVTKGVTIGDGAVVGQLSVVTRDVPAGALAVGAPARVVRENIVWTRDMRDHL